MRTVRGVARCVLCTIYVHFFIYQIKPKLYKFHFLVSAIYLLAPGNTGVVSLVWTFKVQLSPQIFLVMFYSQAEVAVRMPPPPLPPSPLMSHTCLALDNKTTAFTLELIGFFHRSTNVFSIDSVVLFCKLSINLGSIARWRAALHSYCERGVSYLLIPTSKYILKKKLYF